MPARLLLQKGVKCTCRPGTYGGEAGLASSACSGPRAPATTARKARRAHEYRCPAGRYGAPSLRSVGCSGCDAGYYCPEASTRPTEACGGDAVYCPAARQPTRSSRLLLGTCSRLETRSHPPHASLFCITACCCCCCCCYLLLLLRLFIHSSVHYRSLRVYSSRFFFFRDP